MVRLEFILIVKVIFYEGEVFSSFIICVVYGNGVRVEWFMKYYWRSVLIIIYLFDILKLDYVLENIFNLNFFEKYFFLVKGVLC